MHIYIYLQINNVSFLIVNQLSKNAGVLAMKIQLIFFLVFLISFQTMLSDKNREGEGPITEQACCTLPNNCHCGIITKTCNISCVLICPETKYTNYCTKTCAHQSKEFRLCRLYRTPYDNECMNRLNEHMDNDCCEDMFRGFCLMYNYNNCGIYGCDGSIDCYVETRAY